jgi:hypothetical protein
MAISFVSRLTCPRKSKAISTIVMYQKLIAVRIHDVEAQSLYSNPLQFYDFLQNRVMIIFKPKFEEANPETEFSLVLSKKHTYDLVSMICIIKLS